MPVSPTKAPPEKRGKRDSRQSVPTVPIVAGDSKDQPNHLYHSHKT